MKRKELAKFPEIIEKLGHRIMSKHQSEREFMEKESKLTVTEIHDRDFEWLQKANLGIFEISNPSLGVGSEIADMINLGKPVLCLYKKELENNISAYILGKKHSKYIKTKFECYGYRDLGDAKRKIKTFCRALTL